MFRPEVWNTKKIKNLNNLYTAAPQMSPNKSHFPREHLSVCVYLITSQHGRACFVIGWCFGLNKQNKPRPWNLANLAFNLSETEPEIHRFIPPVIQAPLLDKGPLMQIIAQTAAVVIKPHGDSSNNPIIFAFKRLHYLLASEQRQVLFHLLMSNERNLCTNQNLDELNYNRRPACSIAADTWGNCSALLLKCHACSYPRWAIPPTNKCHCPSLSTKAP